MAKKSKTIVFDERKAALKIFILAIIVLLFGLWGWYRFIFTNAENVFWGTVDANLKTYGVTRTIKQSQQGSTVDRYIQLQFGSPTGVKDTSVIKQTTENSSTTVTSEVIETADQSFIRYPELASSQGDVKRDFSEVVGVWAEDKNQTNNTTLMRDAIIGPLYAIPFANLPADKRAEFVSYIKNMDIYDVDFSSVKKESRDGRQVYRYNAKTNVPKYIEMVKKLDVILGMNQLQEVDTSQYASQPPIEVVLLIDVKARQITEVSYPGNGQTEQLGAYGARVIDQLPQPQLTREELETKLQKIVQ